MRLVRLRVDGREIEVEEGTNLIDAAEVAGIYIPRLCYIKGMKGVGVCRLCVVEIEGKLIPACITMAREGMNVITSSKRVLEARRFLIDLLLSAHPLDCLTCIKSGACELQRYAYELGVDRSSFTPKRFGYPIDDANPFIRREPDYCVLCTRCVRVCKSQGTKVLDIMRRGIHTKITTARDIPLHLSDCTFCGSCIDVCPTRAIVEAGRGGREWEYKNVKSVCLHCGIGCEIDISVKDDEVVRVRSGAKEEKAERYICALGRFGFDYYLSNRINSPLLRENGALKEITWGEALEIVSRKLREAGEDVGFISTASILNEDALTLRRFAEDVVRTKNFATTVDLYSHAHSLRLSSTSDLDLADLIVVVGLNPSQWERVLPALDASIRKRVDRGAKLILISSQEIRLSTAADISIIGDELSSLKGLIKALIGRGYRAVKEIEDEVSGEGVSEDIERAASLYAGARSPIILSIPSLFQASANLALLESPTPTSHSVVAVGAEANSRGVVLMGLGEGNTSYIDLISGAVKVLYVIGDPLLKERPNVNFLIVQNYHLTQLARVADIVLPSTSPIEEEGSIIDYLGRLKHVGKAIRPRGESKMHRRIFVELSGLMGKPIKEPEEEEIRERMKVRERISPCPFKRKGVLDKGFYQMIEHMKAEVISGSRLSWLER